MHAELAHPLPRGQRRRGASPRIAAQPETLPANPQVLMVNADPHHSNVDTLRVILDKDGNHLIGAKANTFKRLDCAKQCVKTFSF